MKLVTPGVRLTYQQILLYCPRCRQLTHCSFHGRPPSPPDEIQCNNCRSSWPLDVTILEEDDLMNSALARGGIIILPAVHSE